jgi:hypothetical protein
VRVLSLLVHSFVRVAFFGVGCLLEIGLLLVANCIQSCDERLCINLQGLYQVVDYVTIELNATTPAAYGMGNASNTDTFLKIAFNQTLTGL